MVGLKEIIHFKMDNLWIARDLSLITEDGFVKILALLNKEEDIRQQHTLPEGIIPYAVIAGNLPLVKYLYRKKQNMKTLMEIASYTGNLAILKWGYKQGFKVTPICIQAALRNASASIAQWLVDHGAKLSSKLYIIIRGDQKKADWLYKNNCVCTAKECDEILEHYIEKNDLSMIRWLRDHDINMDNFMSIAISSSNDEMVMWAVRNGIEISRDELNLVGTRCSFETLKDCIFHGAPIEYIGACVPKKYAYIGDIKALEWCYNNNIDMSRSYYGAMMGDQLSSYKWLEQKDPQPPEKMLNMAHKYASIPIMQYIRQQLAES